MSYVCQGSLIRIMARKCELEYKKNKLTCIVNVFAGGGGCPLFKYCWKLLVVATGCLMALGVNPRCIDIRAH